MKNSLYLLFAVVVLFVSCSKKSNTATPPSNNTAIIGKWFLYKVEIQVHTIAGNTLVKDSIRNFSTSSPDLSEYLIFNNDASLYVTHSADTVFKKRYNVSGTNLITTNTDGSSPETDFILKLNNTNLEFENSYSAYPDAGWGLDTDVPYYFSVYDYLSKNN